MYEQHRRPEKVDHAYPVHEPPDAGVGAHEERVAALQEAVHQEEKSGPHGGGPCIPVWISVVLREALVCVSKQTTKQMSLLILLFPFFYIIFLIITFTFKPRNSRYGQLEIPPPEKIETAIESKECARQEVASHN